MCNKSKLIISWGEQQLCLHLYGVVSTLPSGPSRSVRLENLLIVYLKQLLNPSINALKIYLMPCFLVYLFIQQTILNVFCEPDAGQQNAKMN
jgi:hypothetical protein